MERSYIYKSWILGVLTYGVFILFLFFFQALETEVVMITFQKVYDKLSQAFGDVPCDEMGISDEVKEQV